MSTVAVICAYYEERRIGPALAQLLAAPFVERILVLISTRPWRGAPSPEPDLTAPLVAKYFRLPRVEIVQEPWTSETEQRNDGIARAVRSGATRVLMLDADEYFTADGLAAVVNTPHTNGVRVRMQTYFKTPDYCYEPADTWPPMVYFDPTRVWFSHLRVPTVGLEHLDPAPTVMHHFSFVLSDARWARKIASFSHDDLIRPEWRELWPRWTPGSEENVLPYAGPHTRAVYRPAPPEIRERWDSWQAICDAEGIAP